MPYWGIKMKPYPVPGPFDLTERPFECEFPPELSEIRHGTTASGFTIRAIDPSAEYEADINYSHTHDAIHVVVERYLDEFASTSQQPTWSPFSNSNNPYPASVLLLYEFPLMLHGGYPCYHVAWEIVLPDKQAFSGFHAKAILGDGRVDFTFDAPDRAEVWKERWLKILMSFRLCEGIEHIVDEFDENAVL